MNIKRFAICSLVGFAFVFAYEFVIHGILLVPTYEQTPQLWRPMKEYESFMPLATTMQLLTTAVLCFIYTRHYEGKGLGEGMRFGIMMGLLLGLMQFSSYAWMPISMMLAGSWLVVTLVKTIGLGVIFSLIYKK